MSIGRVPGETGIQPGIVTTKGDLIVATGNASVVRQGVGSNNQVLMADSAQADGVKWADEATATLTTTGDILYASAANTLARRAIGSTGDVLTVSGGVPTWATPSSGSMTLLSTTTLSGSSTTISSISASYTDLFVEIYGISNATAASYTIQLNGSANTSTMVKMTNTNNVAFSNGIDVYLNAYDFLKVSNTNNSFSLYFYNYADTSHYKNFTISSGYYSNSNTQRAEFSSNTWASNSAINSIKITPDGGSMTAGTVKIYGVK